MGKYNLDKITRQVKEKTDKDRFRHSKGVAYTATALVMKYCSGEGQSEMIEKAMVAGLLHDYAKCLSENEILNKCIKFKVEISDSEKNCPFLLHGKLAACYARNKFEIYDEDIINAVAYHTTGRPDMSLLEKIIFVADYIEPGRTKQPNLDLVRTLAFTDIDKCVYKISDDTLNYLGYKKKLIDNMTVLTRDFYEKYK